ncbi:hypothetical protein [Actinomadura rupiterrae]|uniref:hypothetical protein n=1 Tax=Actinomadura rupiterrae TaxID=559627 RepID=UPI0020A3AA26|nr:hypothetical protein [Actinomadura rupiterrae]MCP2342401.1 hypothetical protein [Actinomadura rupiterrae]
MIVSGAAGARCARGLFLAATCTALALAGHTIGGRGACCVPPLPAVAGTGAVVGVLCVAVAGRMMSFWKILVVVGWAQVAFHLAFTAFAGTAFAGTGMHHDMAAAAPPPPAGGMSWSMLGGHALAAVAAAVLLAGAERTLWWLAGAVFAVVAIVLLLLGRPDAPERAPWIVVPDSPAPRLGVLLARAVRRRGPPAGALHAA